MQIRDWRERNRWIADLLKRRTGDDLQTWNARVREAGLGDKASLRAWLDSQCVTGYPHRAGLTSVDEVDDEVES